MVKDLVATARAIADDVLFPAAAEVDAKGEVPRGHFDLLAAEGFYGLAAPPEHGGPGLEFPQIVAVLETLAGGCLSTMFTWVQHHGLVMGLVGAADPALRERYLPRAVAGELRGGVAFAAVIPEVPRVRATRVDGGYTVHGEAPFVSGWGGIDLLQLSARDADTVVNALIDPVEGPGLSARRLDLVAVQGTATVQLRLDGYFVPDARVLSRVPHPDFLASHRFGSRLNGCAPLGLAERCARLLAEAGHPGAAAAVRAEQHTVRAALDAGLADPEALAPARAAGSDLAYRAAGALVTAVSSRALLHGEHPQRLVREAAFLLVAASRPEMRSELLDRFTDRGGSGRPAAG